MLILSDLDLDAILFNIVLILAAFDNASDAIFERNKKIGFGVVVAFFQFPNFNYQKQDKEDEDSSDGTNI